MNTIHLSVIDYAILSSYVAFVIGIGWMLSRYMKTSSDFLIAPRTIPTWVTGLAFMSANVGALELVGMAASGAKYGMSTNFFYWAGAVPAMVFLAVFMMPFYYGSKARSVPEYLKFRFDERVRALNSVAFSVMTIFASGISMNALAKLLNQLLGWNYDIALWICSGVVLLYVLKGGLTSAIYTEVLQFFLIILGFAPVVYLGLRDLGGWQAMKSSLQKVSVHASPDFGADAWTSTWRPILAGSAHNPMGVDIFSMLFGLCFVLGFGYWCTNFLVVQRAMAAKNMSAARHTPLVAALAKMFFPFLVIVPGMVALALTGIPGKGYRIPPPVIAKEKYNEAVAVIRSSTREQDLPQAVAGVERAIGAGVNHSVIAAAIQENARTPLPDERIIGRIYESISEYDYDGIIVSLVKRYCPPGMLGLALTALLASFMSGMAGNVTAFNTVFTYDLYQAYVAPNKSDLHYFWTGKFVTFAGILLSIAAAYFASLYNNAMDIIQLVFGFVNAPLFATFLLGMFWKRTTATGAFLGLFGGIVASTLFHACTSSAANLPGVKGGYLTVLQRFPSEMAQNFWLAGISFTVCLVLTVMISLATKQTKTDDELKGLVYSLTPKQADEGQKWYLRPAFLGIVLLALCAVLNLLFW